jgi:hypothetical protein
MEWVAWEKKCWLQIVSQDKNMELYTICGIQLGKPKAARNECLVQWLVGHKQQRSKKGMKTTRSWTHISIENNIT